MGRRAVCECSLGWGKVAQKDEERNGGKTGVSAVTGAFCSREGTDWKPCRANVNPVAQLSLREKIRPWRPRIWTFRVFEGLVCAFNRREDNELLHMGNHSYQ